MTSQLNVDTIVDKAGSGGTNVRVANNATYLGENGSQHNIKSGLIAAWIYSADDAGVNASYNISSGTDNSTGYYSYTFTSNLATSDLGAAGSAHDNADRVVTIYSQLTTGYDINVFQQNGTVTDCRNRTIVGGDLA